MLKYFNRCALTRAHMSCDEPSTAGDGVHAGQGQKREEGKGICWLVKCKLIAESTQRWTCRVLQPRFSSWHSCISQDWLPSQGRQASPSQKNQHRIERFFWMRRLSASTPTVLSKSSIETPKDQPSSGLISELMIFLQWTDKWTYEFFWLLPCITTVITHTIAYDVFLVYFVDVGEYSELRVLRK